VVSEWESAHGPYVGVGPRGYRRSDERIREDLCERFAEHGQLDPSDVEVAVHDGEVLLTGSVATRTQKRLAEDIADRVFGVVEVQNHLRVQRAGEAAQMPRGAPATVDVGRAHPSNATHR
jgi:osmotically-inducible protein OsmY